MRKVTIALTALLLQIAPARATFLVGPGFFGRGDVASDRDGGFQSPGKWQRDPKFRSILDSMPGGKWTQDATGPKRWVRYWNRWMNPAGWITDELGNPIGLIGEGLWGGDRKPEFEEYGNWAGAGWWGGGRDADSPGDHPPLDAMDEAAMRHDFTYQLAEERGRIYGDNERLRIEAIADQILVQNALDMDPDPANWIPPPKDIERARRFRERMIWFFTRAKPYKDTKSTAEWAGGWIRHPIDSWNLSGTHLTEEQVIKEVNKRQDDWFQAHPQHANAPGGPGILGGPISGSLPGGPGVQPVTGSLPGGPAPGSPGTPTQPGAGPAAAPPGGAPPSSGPGTGPEIQEKKPSDFFLGP